MRIALHNADKTNFPNLPLMKLSAYHKRKGDQVDWYIPIMKEYYHRVYSSKVFSFESNDILLPKETIKGGTGYNSDSVLPQEIEHIMPDYSLYPAFKGSLGFTTRGCIRNCPWCVVPKKEGNIKAHADIEEFIRNDSNKVILMDNNILAHEHGIKQLEKSIALGLRIDCNQGLDARLISEDMSLACLLGRIKWIRFIRMACDSKDQMIHIEKATKAIRKYKPNQEISCYVLVKDIPDALERVKFLRKLEVKPFAQPYRSLGGKEGPDKDSRHFARWVNHKAIFYKVEWEDYKYNVRLYNNQN